MRLVISICVVAICSLCSFTAHSQTSQQSINEDSIQKVHIDSVQRVWMKDSLGLSDNVISQVFALRDTCFAQTMRIRTNPSLTPAAQIQSINDLRQETDDAIKNLMGESIYGDYREMIISGRKKS